MTEECEFFGGPLDGARLTVTDRQPYYEVYGSGCYHRHHLRMNGYRDAMYLHESLSPNRDVEAYIRLLRLFR